MALRAEGKLRPYRFTRTLELAAGASTFYFRYEVENRGSTPLPFIWSAHPLLSVRPEAIVTLPAETRLNAFFCVPEGSLSIDNGRLVAPLRTSTLDGELAFALPDHQQRFAFKVWSDPLASGTVAICDADGVNCLDFTFDPAEIPNVGLWINARGWSGRPAGIRGRRSTRRRAARSYACENNSARAGLFLPAARGACAAGPGWARLQRAPRRMRVG